MVLTIRRDNEDLQVEAVRKLIKSTTISYRLIGDNGYIKISKFDETTFDDFKMPYLIYSRRERRG